MQKIHWLIVMACLPWASPVSVGGYERRQREVEKIYEDMQARLSEAERAAMKPAIAAYFEERARALDLLLGLIKESSLDTKDSGQKWEAEVKRMRVRLKDTLGSCTNSIRDAGIASLGITLVVTTQEDKFWAGLLGVDIASRRDQLAGMQRALKEREDSLDMKWQTLRVEDDAIDERLRRVIADVKDSLNAAVNTAAAARKTAIENVRVACELVSKGKIVGALVKSAVPEAADAIRVLEAAGKPLSDIISSFEKLVGLAENRRDLIRGLVDTELRLIGVLNVERATTEDFVKKHGKEAIAEAVNASSSLESWSGGLDSDGLKSDASAFARDALGLLAERSAECMKGWEVFRAKNEGRFFGQLREDVREQIVERQIWEDLTGQVIAIKQEEEFEELRKDSGIYFHIEDLGLTAETKDSMRDILRVKVEMTARANEEAIRKLNDSKLTEMLDRMKVYAGWK